MWKMVFLLSIFYYFQHFKANPYFENTTLTKTFSFPEEGTNAITATQIKWKEGMVSFHLHFEDGPISSFGFF